MVQLFEHESGHKLSRRCQRNTAAACDMTSAPVQILTCVLCGVAHISAADWTSGLTRWLQDFT